MINVKETQCKSTQIITLHPNWPKIALKNATTFAIFNIFPWSKKINHSKCYFPSIVFCSLPPLLYLQERPNVTSQCCWILRLAGGPPHMWVTFCSWSWKHYVFAHFLNKTGTVRENTGTAREQQLSGIFHKYIYNLI